MRKEYLEINKAVNFLKEEKLILYPTDTVWGIGCDATSSKAIEKIYNLKRRPRNKAMICLFKNYEMLNLYIPKISNVAIHYLGNTRPTTIIFDNSKGISKKAIAKDNSIATRIPNHDFCYKLISKFGKPIISTSANVSSKSFPTNFYDIKNEILDGVDYVVNLEKEKVKKITSRIIKIDSLGKVTTIRS